MATSPRCAALRRWCGGGRLAIGEGYWKQAPAPEYLEVLGGTADEFTSHEGNIRLGEAYEHPEDPDRDAMLRRSRTWRAGYLRWGRSTLGFGLYLFEKP